MAYLRLGRQKDFPKVRNLGCPKDFPKVRNLGCPMGWKTEFPQTAMPRVK